MIYFIRFRDALPVKIGQSRNPASRLSNLRARFQVDLSIVRTIDVRFQTFSERWLHNYFVERHIWGEWFKFDPEMMTIIPPAPIGYEPNPPVVTITGNRSYDDRLFMDFRPSAPGGYFLGHALGPAT